MTIEEIFNKIITHAMEGTIYHDEMARVYDFIGLYGYSLCQRSHQIAETKNFMCLQHYYMTHYFKLPVIENLEPTKLIPESWYKYTTMAVDAGTKRNAVKELMEKWVAWEQETKKLYQEMRQELCTLGEYAAALELDKYILDVAKELHHAQKKLIQLETIGYDIITIIDWQEDIYNKYKKKLGW